MIIALDYDSTITKDPAAFREIVRVFEGRGHNVIIVTARHGIGGWRDPVERISMDWKVPVIYCGGEKKRKYCNDRGIIVDIWIDDMPWLI